MFVRSALTTSKPGKLQRRSSKKQFYPLNALGSEGWEFVLINDGICLFKRPR